MDFTKGLKFNKFDLHVHTPASDDYSDKSVKPDDIVVEARKKGLAGIAITDHLTGEWIDSVKEAAGEDLIVFPGVELKVTGGKEGIHLIAIFDVDKNTEHITAFLNKLGVYEHKGKTTTVNKTTIQVAQELLQYDDSAILILAHCDSSYGVNSEMRGDQRNNIFAPELTCLVGAEDSKANFLNQTKIDKSTRIIDLFDGTYEVYRNKLLGVYQASDAHSIEAIGSCYTYFKVDELITIEDIRQSLLDRDTRIRQSFEYNKLVYPKVDRMKITSGFLDDQEIIFHEGLNSILGAKGSGKSLTVEFLRFCLNQPPKSLELKTDHNTKLEKCLKLHGEIEVIITDESGKKYKIKRIYNPAEGNPIEITDPSDDTAKSFQIEQIFQVLFLSQNEIIKIAEDQSNISQREFIDQFFDFYKYQHKIDGLNNTLREIDQKLVRALNSHLKLKDLKNKINTYKEEIKKIDRQIQNEVFDEYSKKEKIGIELSNHYEFLETLKRMLEDTQEEYNDISLTTTGDPTIDQEPAVKRSTDIVSALLDKTRINFENITRELDRNKDKIKEEITSWNAAFNPIKDRYEKLVKETGGNQIALDQKRKKLNEKLSKCEQEIIKYHGRAQQAKTIASKRNQIVDQLDEAYQDFYKARKERCEFFTSNSNGSLKVTIIEKGDSSSFSENLNKFKRGSYLKDDEIDRIAEKVMPREFVGQILRYAWSSKNDKKHLIAIADKTNVKIENIEKLVNHMIDGFDMKEILALLYTSFPDDVPSVKYKVNDIYKPLHELSVGQKAVALLIIALSDGKFPIIIDQPEDSLDLRSIWNDVCCKLRDVKDQRQFIFTTHNSSVAVASDTDKFTIIQADASHGKVLYSGSLNRKDIRKEVIDYLEGGDDTYTRKKQKYNY